MGGDVEDARAGDHAAFERLVRVRVPDLLRLAGAIVVDRDLAHDVVQDSLVNAWRHLDSLRSSDAIDAWLRRIVVNTARNAVRGRARLHVLHERMAVDPSEGAADHVAIAAAMRLLDVEHRAVVALHYLYGYSIVDTARLIGVPPGTVKSRLYVARARLRASLGDSDG